jgi:hypothetical protein
MRDVQRVFGCGVGGQTFKAKYEGLSDKDRLRLERVARRVWLTLKLRYETIFLKNPFAWSDEEFALAEVELPSIEVYLLCTCLDTLAGKPNYAEFGDWLKDQKDVMNLGIQEVTCLYEQYKKEHGVSKNLRSLFEDLPQSIKTWLAGNVVIRRANEPLIVAGQDEDLLVKRLCIFFYDFWRNAFTHSSISRQTSIADDVSEPGKGKGWWVTPAVCTHFPLYNDRPNQEWNLSYRQCLDLATILRLIIHAAALQFLNIELTQELISANLGNLSRLNALYAFANEVSSNSSTLNALSKLDERGMSELSTYLVYGGIPLLRSEASVTMADRYNTELPLEAGLREMTIRYLTAVNNLNSAITEFDKANPPPKSPESYSAERWQSVKGFLEEMARTTFYQNILKWPSTVEMTNIWLVIRDPCYT